MSDAERFCLLRVETGDERNQVIHFSQRRSPEFHYPGNGYGYGAILGSVTGHTMSVDRRIDSDRSIELNNSGASHFGSTGFSLGDKKNQVDVCMWGVPPSAVVDTDFEPGTIQVDEGEIVHASQGEFDRRFIVPIHAGTLSLHLATQEWQPIK